MAVVELKNVDIVFGGNIAAADQRLREMLPIWLKPRV